MNAGSVLYLGGTMCRVKRAGLGKWGEEDGAANQKTNVYALH